MTDTRTDKKWQRPLTKAEMAGLLDGIAAAATPIDALIAGLVGFYTIAVPEATDTTFADATSVTPWDYAIPEDQWGAIAEAIMERAKAIDSTHGDGISRANHMLDWMNKGPSGYTRPVGIS